MSHIAIFTCMAANVNVELDLSHFLRWWHKAKGNDYSAIPLDKENQRLIRTHVKAHDAGWYKCEASNQGGKAKAEAEINITISCKYTHLGSTCFFMVMSLSVASMKHFKLCYCFLFIETIPTDAPFQIGSDSNNVVYSAINVRASISLTIQAFPPPQLYTWLLVREDGTLETISQTLAKMEVRMYS